MSKNDITKNDLAVSCHPDSLLVPMIADAEVVVRTAFQLKAVINHSGTLNNGHYTAIVQAGSNWLNCDDKKVRNADTSDLNSAMSYVLFYEKC